MARASSLVLAAVFMVTGLACAPALAACVDPEPLEYRTSDYRAPTPCTLRGGTVVTTEDVRRLRSGASAAVLIDVMPAPRRPADLPAGSLWLPESRWNIPGSVWLANAGLGILPVEEEAHFRRHLKKLTGGDPHRKLVFYCLADCWMSWNAARRAIEWGYAAVHWYPQGSNGWSAAGYTLEESLPLPLEASDRQ